MKRRKRAKKSGGIVLTVLLLLIGVVGVEVVNVYGQIDSVQAEETALSIQLEEKRQANAELQEDLSRADDPEFIKELAREQLGLAEQGERIFYDVNH